MTKNNRRRDPRYPFHGFQVEVRRAAWKPAGSYYSCRLVDLSPNGLAFLAHDATLNPLDKVGFRLQMGGGEAEGRAVVCYRHPEGESLWRYGIMFLEVTPDIGVLLQEAEVDIAEVRAVARALAEEMALESCRSEAERNLWRRQMLLQEAVKAWLERMAELRCRPAVPVSLDGSGQVKVGEEEPLFIGAAFNRSGYVSSQGDHFATVFEVLDFLRGLGVAS